MLKGANLMRGRGQAGLLGGTEDLRGQGASGQEAWRYRLGPVGGPEQGRTEVREATAAGFGLWFVCRVEEV